MPQARAILVGLNQVGDHYGSWDGQLSGPHYDVADMAIIAEQRGFDVREPLLNEAATSESLLLGLKDAADDLDVGDSLLFFYSGHGGQIPNVNDDSEPDHLDETLCLYDRMLIDDELREAWSGFRQGVRIVSITDSCHSHTVFKAPLGLLRDAPSPVDIDQLLTAMRTAIAALVHRAMGRTGVLNGDADRVKAIPDDAALATYRAHQSEYDAIQQRLAGCDFPFAASFIHLAACRDNQLALDGRTNSRFTFIFKRVWKGGAFQGTYRSLHTQLVKHSPRSQLPQLEVLGVNSTLMIDTPALKTS